MDGRDCIYVKFEGSQTPYFAFGVARIRVADEDLVLSPHNKSVNDVDEELLKNIRIRHMMLAGLQSNIQIRELS